MKTRKKMCIALAALLFMTLTAACVVKDPATVTEPSPTGEAREDPTPSRRPEVLRETDYRRFTFRDAEGGLSVCKYAGGQSEIVIPSRFDGDDIVEIDDWVFAKDKTLAKVTIPDHVKCIGERAFSGCARLTTVIMGGGVEEIGAYAFADDPELTEVTLSDSLKSIGPFAFCNDAIKASNKLETIRIPGRVTEIAKAAFFSNGLKEVTVPGNVKTIGDGAFGFCESMVSAAVEEGVNTLGAGVFSGCKALKEIWLPASVTKIGPNLLSHTDNTAVIIAPAGSAAEAYALENGIPFRDR